jgi:hypothetical protein
VEREKKCDEILKEVELGERIKSEAKRLKIEKKVVENMKKAQEIQKKWSDKGRIKNNNIEGDMVLLATKELELKQYNNKSLKKLRPKFLGLYRVLKSIEENAFKLELLGNLQFHPIVNTSQLVKYRDSEDNGKRKEMSVYETSKKY